MTRDYLQHGVNALIRAQKRRRAGGIDRRTVAGRQAETARLALIQDVGGEQASTAKLMAVELTVRDMVWLNEIDTAIQDFKKSHPEIKGNGRALSKLYDLRARVAGSLSKDLAVIGFDRVKGEKVLDPYEYGRQQYGEDKNNGTEGQDG